MKKVLISMFVIILIFFSFTNSVNANFFTDDEEEEKIEDIIDEDEGGLFEKIIAKMIGGLAETVFDLTTKEEFGVGFKNYDELIFGNNQTDLSPFTEENWNLMMDWYWRIATIIGGPILIAIVILAWKMIVAGMSEDKRVEAKDNLLRLFFGAAAIGMAPIFVKFVLLLNNSLVKMLVAYTHGSLDDLLGNSLLTNINTGNAIATAIVIAMFAYLFVKINIKFIIRQFTLIVFTIFTPIVAIFWILNKRTIASSIWFGQIIINAFMQFVYTFLFLIYMSFLPESAGWAVSLLWAMMILPLADALQNTMQNLVSRIAGVDNEELANRGIGMASAMGYTVKSIAYQFKGNTENSEDIGNEENKEEGQDFISRIINRSTKTTSKPLEGTSLAGTNYESNSYNIMDDSKAENINKSQELDQTNQKQINRESKASTGGSIKKAYNIGKEAMNLGMYMAEGRNYRTNNYNEQDRKYQRHNINNTRKEDLQNNTNKIITIEEETDVEE